MWSWRLGLITLSALLASCSLLELERQAGTLTRYPVIYGDLQPTNWSGEPIVLILSGDAGPDGRHAVEYYVHHDPGPFHLYVEPGTYEIAVYEDISGGLTYEPGDPALLQAERIVASVDAPRIQVDITGRFSPKTKLPDRFDIAHDSAHTNIAIAHRNMGRVVTMDAREMSLELGQAGMWAPMQYIKELQAGIFFLEPFDEAKVPVLFVHGIGGAPIQFETLAGALDRDRYQPWFFAYPSIFPLQMIAEALNVGLDILRRQHDFDRILVVAHSMGGLVSRAYLNEYSWSRHDYDVDLFVSLASPFGGESGAATYPSEDRGEPGPFSTWISRMQNEEGEAPHIAWTDMAPDSVFLKSLYAQPLPAEVTYTLAFAYDPSRSIGAASDGTVTLESQLRPEAQREAKSERGFLMGHDDVLVEPAAVQYVMDRIRAANEPPR